MDVAKYETFRNFAILNKALMFLIKLNKTACNWYQTYFLFLRYMITYFLNKSNPV